MNLKQIEKFWKLITEDDLEFYEEFIIHLPDEEQKKFFEEIPDFMSDFPVWRGRADLLKDRMYRKLLRRIKSYEEGLGR